MKIAVVCDARGKVESVAIPNPALADSVGLEAPPGGRVHILDVSGRAMGFEDLLDPKNEAARRKVYEKLRAMIVRARAPRRRHGRRSRRRSR